MIRGGRVLGAGGLSRWSGSTHAASSSPPFSNSMRERPRLRLGCVRCRNLRHSANLIAQNANLLNISDAYDTS